MARRIDMTGQGNAVIKDAAGTIEVTPDDVGAAATLAFGDDGEVDARERQRRAQVVLGVLAALGELGWTLEPPL